MKNYCTLYTILLAQLITYAQFRYSPSITEFKVSNDNFPSTFIQEGTQFFPSNLNGGLYIWQDYRLGELKYFAQKVDSLGNKMGKNFEIFSNLDLCFAPDGSFLVLKESSSSSYYPGGWDGFYTIDGQIYLDENTTLSPFNVASGILPWCGTGWLGIHNALTRTENHYLNFHASGGAVSFSKYDFNGNLIFQIIPYDSLPTNAYDIVCAANNLNEYVLFSLQITSDYLYGNLFSTFFSTSDSIIAKNVLIDTTNFYADYSQSNHLKAMALHDSTYQIFYLSRDSLSVYYWKINHDGNQISAQRILQLSKSQLTGYINRYVTNYSITPLVDDKFSLLVTINESRYPIDKDFHSLFAFNANGELIEAQFDSSLTLRFGNHFIRTKNGDILIPSDLNQDAYQRRFTGFNPIDSTKLNDDLAGSNELSSIVHEINNHEMLISYVDEINNLCKKIDHYGNLLTEKEQILDNRNINFFPDGWSIGIWYEEDPTTYQERVGYSIYDQDFNCVSKVYLTSFQLGNTNISSKVLSDSVFVIAFYDMKQLFVRLYNRDGEMKEEKLLLSDVYNYPISIFSETENSFLISTYQYSQFFDSNLEVLSPQYSQQVFNYLGNNKVLSISSDDYRYLYGQIFHLDGTQLTSKFFLAISSIDYYIDRLNDDYFGVVYRINNNIYVKCFSSLGTRVGDSILVHLNVNGYRKNPRFTVSNNKVFFVWSDARNLGSGYDIYCSIFNLSDITEINDDKTVKELSDFELSQNYPNPFNPSTIIKFEIPTSPLNPSPYQGDGNRERLVTLKVYDVLGNEVATLVNEYKPAGIYEVELDGSKLSSGVYFYQLKAGNYFETRKMVLLR
jgi:hypothetical protein